MNGSSGRWLNSLKAMSATMAGSYTSSVKPWYISHVTGLVAVERNGGETVTCTELSTLWTM